jgi:hypothetical protein
VFTGSCWDEQLLSFQPNSDWMSSSVIMVILAGLMDIFPWKLSSLLPRKHLGQATHAVVRSPWELYTRFFVAFWLYAFPWCSGAVFAGRRFQLAWTGVTEFAPLLF